MTMDQILPNRNEAWGFVGTLENHADTKDAWEIAFYAIAEQTCASKEGVRAFLDSRSGRHFADDVSNYLGKGNSLQHSIDNAIDRWMSWSTTK